MYHGSLFQLLTNTVRAVDITLLMVVGFPSKAHQEHFKLVCVQLDSQ